MWFEIQVCLKYLSKAKQYFLYLLRNLECSLQFRNMKKVFYIFMVYLTVNSMIHKEFIN